jgi:hypothetical protein
MDTSAAERAGIVTSGQDPPARPNLPVRRALVLTAVLVGCVMAYGLMLAQFDLSKRPGEAEFGAPFSDGPVRLYLQPIQIDPLNASLQMRISVAPAPARATIGDRDFVLNIQRGKQVEHIQIRTNQPLPEATYEFDLTEGDVRDYPFDRYVSTMTLAASEQDQDGTEKSLPIHVTAWEGVLGFSVKGQPVFTQQAGGLRLRFAIRRTGAFSFFGIAIYGAMAVIAFAP